MTYRGHVKGGVIILDAPVQLPEGAEVEVRTAEKTPANPTWAEVLRDVIGKAEGLPNDSSVNHDHYLYGAPKKGILHLPIRHISSRGPVPSTHLLVSRPH
jgi:hypothetical protein